ncbi:MAG: hypothetical protein ABSF77_07825 [Spirochaetia bacterium]|jgi:hypothetical protein
MTDDTLALMKANLEGMRKSVEWLRRSHVNCARIGIQKIYRRFG